MMMSNLATITAVSPVITFRPTRGRLPAQELHETFLAVVEQGSESQAADVLYLSQSTINYRLRLLETRLGVALFARQRGRPPQLTVVGEAVLEKLQAMRDRLAVTIRVLAYPRCGHIRVEAVDNPHLDFTRDGARVRETAVYICWECFKQQRGMRTLEPGSWFVYPEQQR